MEINSLNPQTEIIKSKINNWRSSHSTMQHVIFKLSTSAMKQYILITLMRVAFHFGPGTKPEESLYHNSMKLKEMRALLQRQRLQRVKLLL